MNGLIPIEPGNALPCLPPEDIHRAASYAQHEKAEATRKAYLSDFDSFRRWFAGLAP